ncbi:hypothetical protein LLH00_04150 [bacterium]|nr:hypothetical protein [bacterium]
MSNSCKEARECGKPRPVDKGRMSRRDFFVAGAFVTAILGMNGSGKADAAGGGTLTQMERAVLPDSECTAQTVRRQEIKTQKIVFDRGPGESNSILFSPVLAGEVTELATDAISISGHCSYVQAGREDVYDVLLVMSGKAAFSSAENLLEAVAEQIIRPPYGNKYRIEVKAGDEFRCLRVRRTLTAEDIEAIRQNADMHSGLYAKKYTECQAYTEAIKSPKTINRMLLPEGYVPRLCMGTVETTGPDSVGVHDHPMLDQLFLGLKNCRCTCNADGAEALLLENTLLHIPLGSKHSASVKQDELLSYLWMDMFLTAEGQSYINSQHKMVEPKQK